ncbi:hypothetical protein [Ruixingdingia sedimenti]|uniref:Uncharacterized protein n=1 Tax=Ruixingdingia sedimenti TaxID=3073604 RepID=A0ABU1FDM6_9RHOB|nr:hypothetical protein [Xinfangfangia sp. LG-4]MDR5654995.1 hypothetical protein [Xinfangfangia sp. LG-4]
MGCEVRAKHEGKPRRDKEAIPLSQKPAASLDLHPGSILGNLAKHASREELEAYGALNPDGTPLIDPANDKKNFAQGAATTVWCATAPELEGIGGVYCEDCDIAPIETEGRFGVRPYAADPELAEALWAESVRLTGADLKD